LTGDLIWPVFFLLALVAILAGTWLLWARRFWLAAMLSLVVVFAAAGPVCSLMYGDTRLSEVLLCSAVFYQWPVYLRPGYIMAQVVLPLGTFLMIVLQIRALARKYHKIHAGYFFWAIFLLCAAVIGLMSLEGQAQPVFPSMRQMAGKIAPLPEQTLSDAGTAAPESRDLEPAEPGTDDESALVEPEPDQGDPESRIEALEREIEELKAQLNAQEEIISDLKLRLEGEDGAESPDEPGEEASPDEPEPSPEEKPVITRGGRRI